jgi:2-oxoglutarate ferredoxin oxidoreductase subunit alpha
VETKDKHIVIGGEAGQGLVTIGQMLTKALARSGYEVLVAQHYMSRVRGGHNTYRIRTGNGEIVSPVDGIDILVALDQETVSRHKANMTESGIVILDETLDPEGLKAVRVPFKELAPRPIYQNIAGLAVVAELLGIGQEVLQKLIRNTFRRKGDEVVTQNLTVLDEACRWTEAHKSSCTPLPPAEGDSDRMVIHGNEAIALGALAAGVKCCFFYPMTPATSVAQNLITYGAGVSLRRSENPCAHIGRRFCSYDRSRQSGRCDGIAHRHRAGTAPRPCHWASHQNRTGRPQSGTLCRAWRISSRDLRSCNGGRLL